MSTDEIVDFEYEYVHRDLGSLIPVAAFSGWTETPDNDSTATAVVVAFAPHGTNYGPYVFIEHDRFIAETMKVADA